MKYHIMNSKVLFKKMLVNLTLLMITVIGYGQKVDSLEIMPEGINGFLVKDFAKKSEKDIFTSVNKWTEYNIHDADYAKNSAIENEYISFKVNGIGPIHYKNKAAWKLELYVEIRIKPEKVRIDIELLEIKGIKEGQSSLPIWGNKGSIIMGLYKKNGQPVKGYEATRKEINQVLNGFANRIFDSVDGKADYKKDDW